MGTSASHGQRASLNPAAPESGGSSSACGAKLVSSDVKLFSPRYRVSMPPLRGWPGSSDAACEVVSRCRWGGRRVSKMGVPEPRRWRAWSPWPPPTPRAPGPVSIMIRTEDGINRNVGESQPLLRVLIMMLVLVPGPAPPPWRGPVGGSQACPAAARTAAPCCGCREQRRRRRRRLRVRVPPRVAGAASRPPRCANLFRMIRTQDEMNRNVGESQSLLRF
jgi:hypothetical protein